MQADLTDSCDTASNADAMHIDFATLTAYQRYKLMASLIVHGRSRWLPRRTPTVS